MSNHHVRNNQGPDTLVIPADEQAPMTLIRMENYSGPLANVMYVNGSDAWLDARQDQGPLNYRATALYFHFADPPMTPGPLNVHGDVVVFSVTRPQGGHRVAMPPNILDYLDGAFEDAPRRRH